MSERRRDALVVSGIALFVFIPIVIVTFFTTPTWDVWYCFRPWGNQMVDYGLGTFYGRSVYNTDYPPLSLLLIVLMTLFTRWVGASEQVTNFVFRLPSIFFFVASIYVFFFLLKHFQIKGNRAYIITLAYAMMWGFWMNIFWGQLDVIILFFIQLVLLLVLKEKFFLALLFATLAVLIKYNALLALPVLGIVIAHKMWKQKRVLRFAGYVSICIAVVILFYIPFIYSEMGDGRIFFFFEVLTRTFMHSQYYSANAFNFYSMFGLDYVAYPAWYFAVNTLVLAFVIVLCTYLYFRRKTDEVIVVSTGLLVSFIYMFSTNMHSRYVIMGLGAMLIAAHLVKNKPMIISVHVMSFVQFFAMAFIWAMPVPTNWNAFAIPFSVLNLIAFLVFAFFALKYAYGDSLKKACVADNQSEKPEVS